MEMRKTIILSCLTTIIGSVANSHAANCIEYSGFWVLNRENSQRKNYREYFYSPQGKSEIRGYYEIFNPKDVYLEHDFGRTKDSLGKCFTVLDTAIQQDTSGAPKGRISTGSWFSLPPIIKDIDGTKIIREIDEDLGKLDTIDVKFKAEVPLFINKALISASNIEFWKTSKMKKSFPIPFNGYYINGRRWDGKDLNNMKRSRY